MNSEKDSKCSKNESKQDKDLPERKSSKTKQFLDRLSNRIIRLSRQLNTYVSNSKLNFFRTGNENSGNFFCCKNLNFDQLGENTFQFKVE